MLFLVTETVTNYASYPNRTGAVPLLYIDY